MKVRLDHHHPHPNYCGKKKFFQTTNQMGYPHLWNPHLETTLATNDDQQRPTTINDGTSVASGLGAKRSPSTHLSRHVLAPF
jgi:hypothetical protein